MLPSRNCCQIALLGLVPGLLLIATSSFALSITYTAVNLEDQIPGQDLYRYDYALDEFPYSAGFGFSIQFAPTLYALLQSPPASVGPDWDIIALQPDPSLPDDGLYDALALVNGPLPLTQFSVEFIWLGTGTPGSQPFLVYDAAFSPIESGQTVPIPEPATGLLLGSGLALLSSRGCRSSNPQLSR